MNHTDDDAADAVILICARADDPSTLHVRGSVIRTCSLCESPVFVAPSGQHMIVTRRARIQCVPCAVAKMRAAKAKGEPIAVEQPTAEQQQEIRDHFETRE